MGLLEFAGVALRRAGEGAFLVAEELALNQLRGNGRAVERHERAAARWLFSCSVRATSSLPVPVSP
jgi:hypothetical protein